MGRRGQECGLISGLGLSHRSTPTRRGARAILLVPPFVHLSMFGHACHEESNQPKNQRQEYGQEPGAHPRSSP